MRKRAEYLVLVALSAGVSYWFLLRPPGRGGLSGAARPPAREAVLTVDPGGAEPVASVADPDTKPVRAHDHEHPPPPEAGTPEGETDSDMTTSRKPEPKDLEKPPPTDTPAKSPVEFSALKAEDGARLRKEIQQLNLAKDLREQAESEVSGKQRRGFQTVFLCSAGDQLAIARFFGEQIVLVPRSGLSPERPAYYRLDSEPTPGVELLHESPPLQRFRQYRDLFAFPYESLPAPIRELRRRVFMRGDIYLFAALIPPAEWGLVIARRRAALAAHARAHNTAPRRPEDVRRFTMRYVRLPTDAFDIRVTEIEFSDGSRWKVGDRT